jgi:hypothetical protein
LSVCLRNRLDCNDVGGILSFENTEPLGVEYGPNHLPRQVPHSFRCSGHTPGRLLVTLSPAGFEGFFEEVGALSPQQQQVPTVIEIGQKYGLEFLPPAST